MGSENPSIMSHVSIGTNNFDAATAFYDLVMPTIGARRILEISRGVAYGKAFPEFWVQVPHDDNAAQTANGTHFAFFAPSKSAVDDFWEIAIKAGAKEEGEPGSRQPYYGCFVRDLDGHKIEAMTWDGKLEHS
ncbi:MAG: VOC family protein [Hyphomicrobiales bacterium]|nr:VOC family protein [Hyphomicrobiales bacterium]